MTFFLVICSKPCSSHSARFHDQKPIGSHFSAANSKSTDFFYSRIHQLHPPGRDPFLSAPPLATFLPQPAGSDFLVSSSPWPPLNFSPWTVDALLRPRFIFSVVTINLQFIYSIFTFSISLDAFILASLVIPLFVLFVLDPTHQHTHLGDQTKYLAALHLLMSHIHQRYAPRPQTGEAVEVSALLPTSSNPHQHAGFLFTRFLPLKSFHPLIIVTIRYAFSFFPPLSHLFFFT